MKRCYFAVDLGASSGRTVLGTFVAGKLETEELTRFPNHLVQVGNHYYWDIYELYRNIIESLKIAAARNIEIISIGIDTWGCDFVMVGADGQPLRLPYSYRDPHTLGAPELLFNRFPREKLYKKTGIQVMNFNTLFQLDTLRRYNDSALAAAQKILFIPDALNYMLTGVMVTEYTIASTGQIVNAVTRKLDSSLLKLVGLSTNHFGPLVQPGTIIGRLSKGVQEMTGLGAVPVIAVAGHDTASAVAAIPAETDNIAYISSGTWSLMGVEIRRPVISRLSEHLNFTNEGGIEGTIRLLKNISGMWLFDRCRKTWGEVQYDTLIKEASESEPFGSLINPDDPRFNNPVNMQHSIYKFCIDTGQLIPSTRGCLTRCIFESLAMRYRQTLENLKQLADHPINTLHIIGGASRNAMLNQFTANAIGMPVIAGPYEATALGNLMMQVIALGGSSDISQMRTAIRKSLSLSTFYPEDTDLWDKAYLKFTSIVNDD